MDLWVMGLARFHCATLPVSVLLLITVIYKILLWLPKITIFITVFTQKKINNKITVHYALLTFATVVFGGGCWTDDLLCGECLYILKWVWSLGS